MKAVAVAEGERAPTMENAGELQQAYDHFNVALFTGELPACLITLQRQANCHGYFSPGRFVHRTGHRTDEIAMNPEYFANHSVLETLQTLVHEMVHLWQFHFGSPGRRSYHNREWAEKMEAIGLMPSSTGFPGGDKTGDRVADYPISGGAFLSAAKALLTSEFRISWVDRFPARPMGEAYLPGGIFDFDQELGVPVASETQAIAELVRPPAAVADAAAGAAIVFERPKSNTRSKYACPGCRVQVWGKPQLNLKCGDCDQGFSEVVAAGAFLVDRRL